ncbi:MAG: thioredoxin [Burkholderiales bacterium]|jgi:thioredoxin 1|nr:thioredoxin [Burkholderiales bacterium]
MATVTLTSENFDTVVRGDKPVVIDFWAPWCGPCRGFAPVFEAASEKHADVVFAKLNTEDEPDIAGQFGIRAIPTLMAFREQVMLYNEAGAMPAGQLDALVEQVKALDMTQVHADIAAQEAATPAA